jgi:hypothetical protein
MIAISDMRVLQAAAQVNTHSSWFVDFLREWRQAELLKLAYAKDGLPIVQGRVQTLDEVIKLFVNAETDLRRAQS